MPYSDAYSIPFIAGAIYLLTILREQRTFPVTLGLSFLFGLCVFIGYLIKPTVILILICAVIALIISLGAKRHSLTMRRELPAQAIGIALAAALSLCVVAPWSKVSLEYTPDPNKEITAAHFLMMGANPETYGAFSFDDMALTRNAESVKEAQKLDIDEYFNRVREYGAGGYAVFLSKKALIAYSDGMFGVGGEGQPLPPDPAFMHRNPFGGFGEALRSVLYVNANTDSDFHLLKETRQVLWFGILLCLPFAFAYYRSHRDDNGIGDTSLLAVMLSLIGLVAFLSLFESRSRYVFCYLPVFSILASCGITWLVERFALGERPAKEASDG